MDIDRVEIGSALWSASNAMVTFTKAVGPLVVIPSGESVAPVDTEAVFGIDGTGPYFDPQGAAPGDHAELVVDSDGTAYLDPNPS